MMYCPSLWKSVHVDTDGQLSPCCLFVSEQAKKDKIIKITDIKKIEDVLKNDFQTYRDDMLEGKWPIGCNQCELAEKEGRVSKRQSDMWMAKRIGDSPTDVSLKYLQLKTGRLCNLKCTICGPQCSTAIATEQLSQNIISKETYNLYQKDIAWSYDLDQYNKLNSSNSYYRIDLAGGEPLMNKTHFEWLDSLEHTEDTMLFYNTNGTFKPTANEFRIWKKFKEIHITFSIDSYESKFEALRVGAKWETVIENLKYCNDIIQRDFTNSNVGALMTLHKDNILDVFELHKRIKDIITIDPTQYSPLYFNNLDYPSHLAYYNSDKLFLAGVRELWKTEMEKLDKSSPFYKLVLPIFNNLVQLSS